MAAGGVGGWLGRGAAHHLAGYRVVQVPIKLYSFLAFHFVPYALYL
jgi:hypothetical protein